MSLDDRDYMRDCAKRRLKGLDEMPTPDRDKRRLRRWLVMQNAKRLEEKRAAGDRLYHTPPREFRWSKLLVIVPAAFGTAVGIGLLLSIAERITAHGLLDLRFWAQEHGFVHLIRWWVTVIASSAIGAWVWLRLRRL